MPTRTLSSIFIAAAMTCAIVVATSGRLAAAEGRSGEVTHNPNGTINDPRLFTYSDRSMEGTAILDAVDNYYPPNTSGNIYDRRLHQYTHPQSGTQIMDNVGRLYPMSTSGTRSEPSLLRHTNKRSGEEIMDALNRLSPPR